MEKKHWKSNKRTYYLGMKTKCLYFTEIAYQLMAVHTAHCRAFLCSQCVKMKRHLTILPLSHNNGYLWLSVLYVCVLFYLSFCPFIIRSRFVLSIQTKPNQTTRKKTFFFSQSIRCDYCTNLACRYFIPFSYRKIAQFAEDFAAWWKCISTLWFSDG